MASIGVMGKLILAFVTLLLGAVLITTISTNTQAVTTYDTSVSESHPLSLGCMVNGSGYNKGINTTYSYTLTNRPTGWKVDDCPISSFRITNSSGTAFTVTTDYVLTASAGTYTLKNTIAVNQSCAEGDNSTLVDYNYCGDDYMNLSWGRTGINLVSGFFALAMLLIAVGLFYSVAKDVGIL